MKRPTQKEIYKYVKEDLKKKQELLSKMSKVTPRRRIACGVCLITIPKLRYNETPLGAPGFEIKFE